MSGFDHEKARRNADAIDGEIQSLSSGHKKWFQRQYKEFWVHAKEISGMFKSLKPLKKEDRERLWERYQYVCEEVKAEQKAQREKRKFRSEQKRNDILREVERARPCSLFGFDPPDVREMKRLSRTLKNAGLMLSENKQDMFGEHKQECFHRIQEIRSVHDAWWKELKDKRSRRQQEFQDRVRRNLEKNYERYRKTSDALYRVRSNADDLRSKIASAWSDDFKSRAQVWLSEAEEKIRDIEGSMQQIEKWIREDEEKLR